MHALHRSPNCITELVQRIEPCVDDGQHLDMADTVVE